MRSQGDYGRFWFTFLCRGATATELGEITEWQAQRRTIRAIRIFGIAGEVHRKNVRL